MEILWPNVKLEKLVACVSFVGWFFAFIQMRESISDVIYSAVGRKSILTHSRLLELELVKPKPKPKRPLLLSLRPIASR